MSKVKKIFRSKSGKTAKEMGAWSKEDGELMDAVERGEVSRLRQLLARKGSRVDRIDPKGHTAIHRAAMKGSLDLMHTMLAEGNIVYVTATDLQGRIPLHDACRMGHSDVAEFLLQQQPASKNAVDNFSLTPLHMACMHGKMSCVHLLLRHDVYVDPVDKEERTPLFYASRLGHLDICKMLVARRANYNARDAKHKTPIMVAAETNKPEVCDYLINVGADVNLYDATGKSAIQHAAAKKHEHIVRTLQRSGAVDDALLDDGFHGTYEELAVDVPRTARRDTGFSDKTNSRSDDVDTGIVPLDDIRRLEQQRRKFSSTSGTGDYSELNESGDIVPWDEAMKADIDKVVKAARLNDDSERPLVGVVRDGHNGPVEGAIYAKSSSSSSSSEHGDSHRQHLVQIKMADEEDGALAEESVIRQQRAAPQHPDVVEQWMEHEDVTDGDNRPPVPPHHVDADEDDRLGQQHAHHQEDGSHLNIPWPKLSSSSQESSRRSSVVVSSETQPVLQPPPGFQHHRASVDTSDLDLDLTKQQQQQPVSASPNHQGDLELEIGAMHAHIERLEADNRALQQALEAERQAKMQKVKRRRGSKSDSSSSSSSSDDDEHTDKLSKKKSKKDLKKQTKQMEEDLKDLLEENGNLRRENHLLNDQMERQQDEGERKLASKAAEVDELFKRVEELEEENFTVKGQLLEQGDHPPSVQLELGEEAPLQAASALHLQAAPRPAGAKVKVDDDQLEDVLEENRRLMDELTEAKASRDAARHGEAELDNRCRALQEDRERVQDSLENLRSLLLIVSTQPKVKDDASLASDLGKVTVSVTALCETNDDDPARVALETFLTEYSRLQGELDASEKEIVNLTADAESLRQANARLESNVIELREALEQIREGDPSQTHHDSIVADEMQRLKDDRQDLSDDLKAVKEENGRLRKDLQRALDSAAKTGENFESNEALQAKIEDLERVLKHQDTELEKLRKTHGEKESERKKLEDDMEELQMKNIALQETVACVDSGKLQASKPSLKNQGNVDKDLQDDVARLKRELKGKETAHEKEKKAIEKEMAELNASIEKLEKSKQRHKERAKDLERDHKEKDKSVAELKESVEKLEKANKALLNDLNKLKKEKERGKDLEKDVDDLENANKKLNDEVQKLKESGGSRNEKDKNLEKQIKALEKRIDELENENEELRRDNTRLRNDLDQVALVFDNKQLQPLSQAPSLNSSWSADGVPLSEYAAMIRQKLQELKHSSFNETSRLREDNDRLKDELDHFHKISQHLASKRDREKPAAASAEREEVTLVPTTVVHVHQAPHHHQATNDAEERLKRENIEHQAELVILRHKLQELDSKHKKAAESVNDLERKNKALTSRLQQQGGGHSGTNGDADAREEMLEKRNRDLEAEIVALTKNLKQVQRQNERLSGDLIDGKLNHNSVANHNNNSNDDHDLHHNHQPLQPQQLADENKALKRRLREMEERLTDADESGSGTDRRPLTDSNNNSQIERKLRKQMEDMDKQHKEVVNTYRTHLLAAVQGHLDPAVRQALLHMHVSNQQQQQQQQ